MCTTIISTHPQASNPKPTIHSHPKPRYRNNLTSALILFGGDMIIINTLITIQVFAGIEIIRQGPAAAAMMIMMMMMIMVLVMMMMMVLRLSGRQGPAAAAAIQNGRMPFYLIVYYPTASVFCIKSYFDFIYSCTFAMHFRRLFSSISFHS